MIWGLISIFSILPTLAVTKDLQHDVMRSWKDVRDKHSTYSNFVRSGKLECALIASKVQYGKENLTLLAEGASGFGYLDLSAHPPRVYKVFKQGNLAVEVQEEVEIQSTISNEMSRIGGCL
uniref:Cathepsin propeptide inhibitor domain-containing protein n=1 Tax=Chromera velia CCMP2878 TaxID=1169474 RepID=A0A0G4IDI7_9ALVE|eukprot:Cvel_13386.t1-p1 / transcript=Cvel_13386.t1 / gene=Cvel_13386 / organism=Chromera_velia_CCMP2878 / gene_product=hypothetical protein / transcript_product=hypothetical protein / location=Cvel_scaffold911:41687-42046(-) / protein_length=120 / sequence_SO=supercontig / SO=protein_coding / is_pseudo=false